MEPITTLLVASLALGLGNVKPPSIDQIEYSHIVQVVSHATQQISLCKTNTTDVTALELHIQILNEYNAHLTSKEENRAVSKILNKFIDDFSKREDKSVRYCQHKLSEIQSVSRTLARSIGGLHKHNICDHDLEKRLNFYKDSFAKKAISESEYSELLSDIVLIGKADKSSCDIENTTKIDQATEVAETIIQVLGAI